MSLFIIGLLHSALQQKGNPNKAPPHYKETIWVQLALADAYSKDGKGAAKMAKETATKSGAALHNMAEEQRSGMAPPSDMEHPRGCSHTRPSPLISSRPAGHN